DRYDANSARDFLRAADCQALGLGAALALFDRLGEDSDAELGCKLMTRASLEELTAWLAESSATRLRQRTLIRFAQLQPERARTGFLEAIHAMADTDDRTQLLTVIVGKWARSEPLAAMEWIERMPNARTAEIVWGSVTAQWAQQNPVQVARIAAELPPGTSQRQAVISAVSGWARSDPRAAAAWVERFPEGEWRGAAMEQVVFMWSMRDPVAAASWLSLQPAGASRDRAAAALQRLAVRTDATGSTR
ncbi:MAG TPA: hypothetical protein VM029_12355, partial [Opitutaceae bacterium]|nr:hypothetical protein [Opitutaceae bacterium]